MLPIEDACSHEHVVTAGNGAIGQGNMVAGDAAHVAVALALLKHDALDV
jgi:hypothetical protein